LNTTLLLRLFKFLFFFFGQQFEWDFFRAVAAAAAGVNFFLPEFFCCGSVVVLIELIFVSDVLFFLFRLRSTVLRESLFDDNAAGEGIRESVKQSLGASRKSKCRC
jgi:magnesium-transporting ATPase (P-type)